MNRETDEFAQTDIATHRQWAILSRRQPLASSILHALVVMSNKQNAVVISQQALADYLEASVRAVQRSLKFLVDNRWIEARRVGTTASVNAYVINSRVCWKASRNQRGLAALTANVILAEKEQPDRDDLGHQPPLRQIDRAMFEGVPPIPMVGHGGERQIDLEEWLSAQRLDDDSKPET